MKIKIEYKGDHSNFPYCAYTLNDGNGEYECAWSAESYEAAKLELIARLRKRIRGPDPEEVEI